jgi:hypothetical protein
VLGVSEDPLVSADIVGDPRAAVADLELTTVVDGTVVKVMAWYDNEWDFTHQMIRPARSIIGGAAAPAALPPPRERGQSRLPRRARGRLTSSVRPASLITKQTAAPMIAAAGPWAPARAAPTTIAAPISAGIA